ncbi:hypothetical protein [Pseudonocardia adelaidensis]|uniref:Uncharacterized protein n=1 Tax=Pseudonocardia adelaidensis TaxID=648754 RepID=A0ABP9NQ07_9PSEU
MQPAEVVGADPDDDLLQLWLPADLGPLRELIGWVARDSGTRHWHRLLSRRSEALAVRLLVAAAVVNDAAAVHGPDRAAAVAARGYAEVLAGVPPRMRRPLLAVLRMLLDLDVPVERIEPVPTRARLWTVLLTVPIAIPAFRLAASGWAVLVLLSDALVFGGAWVLAEVLPAAAARTDRSWIERAPRRIRATLLVLGRWADTRAALRMLLWTGIGIVAGAVVWIGLRAGGATLAAPAAGVCSSPDR